MREICISFIFGQSDDILLFLWQQSMGSFFRAWLSTTISTRFAVEPNPTLIALYIKLELLAAVVDAHRISLMGLCDQLYQGLFGILINIFALEITI